MTKDTLIESLRLEMKRGTLVLSVLSLLDEKAYGYALVEKLQNLHIETEGNTLYPLLRRLEKQGLLKSEWSTEETKPRKYYSITPVGKEIRTVLINDWAHIVRNMDCVLRGECNE